MSIISCRNLRNLMKVSNRCHHQWPSHIVVVYGYVKHTLEHYHIMQVDMTRRVDLIL